MLGMFYKIRKATFVEIITKYLTVIYIFLDYHLKFGVVGLHVVLLTNYEFRGKGYNQSENLLEGVNESLLYFMCYFSNLDKISYRRLQVMPLSFCECNESGWVTVMFYT
jgi:hypothetical protein